MLQGTVRARAILSISLLCTACGGGGGGEPASTNTTLNITTTAPASGQTALPNNTDSASGNTSGTTPGNTAPSMPASNSPAATEPATSTNTSNSVSTFTASVTQAPADAATIGGIVTFEVRGNGLGNVELLPATGYTPKWGVFTISADQSVARLDFDTRVLPSGLVQMRISAFNLPGGDPAATEIVVMPARIWTVINPPATAPIFIMTSDLLYRDPKPLQDLMALPDADYQEQLTNNWPAIEHLLQLYVPPGVEFGPGNSIFFRGVRSTCLGQHTLVACREYMNALIGIMNSKQP